MVVVTSVSLQLQVKYQQQLSQQLALESDEAFHLKTKPGQVELGL